MSNLNNPDNPNAHHTAVISGYPEGHELRGKGLHILVEQFDPSINRDIKIANVHLDWGAVQLLRHGLGLHLHEIPDAPSEPKSVPWPNQEKPE